MLISIFSVIFPIFPLHGEYYPDDDYGYIAGDPACEENKCPTVKVKALRFKTSGNPVRITISSTNANPQNASNLVVELSKAVQKKAGVSEAIATAAVTVILNGSSTISDAINLANAIASETRGTPSGKAANTIPNLLRSFITDAKRQACGHNTCRTSSGTEGNCEVPGKIFIKASEKGTKVTAFFSNTPKKVKCECV